MTYLGFDYGEKKIGIAVGNDQIRMAHPLATVPTKQKHQPNWEEIAKLVNTWRPHAFIIGRPVNMDNTDNKMTAAAENFGKALKKQFNRPVYMVDERLSTHTARGKLAETTLNSYKQKKHLDSVEAQTILQAFFDDKLDQANHND